jgi:hypothetical protein
MRGSSPAQPWAPERALQRAFDFFFVFCQIILYQNYFGIAFSFWLLNILHAPKSTNKIS